MILIGEMNRKSFYQSTAKFIASIMIVILALAALPVKVAHAATITSTAAGGNWATAGTWVGGVVPATGDTVIIATTGAGFVNISATLTQTAAGSVTVNSGATLTTSAGIITFGALTINSGGTVTMYRRLIVLGATNISGTINFGSTNGTVRNMTFTGAVTLNSGAVWNETTTGAAATFSFGNSFTNNATTFTAQNTAHNFTGSGMSISGTTTTVIPRVTFTGNYTNSGVLTASTLLTVTGAAIRLTNNGTIIATTALSGTGGVTQGAIGILNIGGTSGITTLTATAVGNTVNYNGAAQTVHTGNYYNLGLSGSAAKTLQAGTTAIGGNLTLSGTATTTTVIGLTIGGNLVIGNGATFTAAGFALNVTGTTTVGGGTSGNLTITSATGTKIFTGLVTVNNGATWNNSVNSTVTFRGGITNNGTFTAGTGVHTFDTNLQALTGTFSIPNVTVTGVTLTNNNTLTVGTALSGTGGLTQAMSSTLNIGGTSGITTLTATAVGNTINYTGAAQTVKATAYSNLNLSGSGAKAIATGTSVGANMDISGTALANIGAGLIINVNSLSLGGVGRASGTWGSTTSSATHTNNTYFSATTGMLNVATNTGPDTTVADGTAPASKFVKGSDTNKAVSAFTLATSSGIDTVTALTVTGSGTGLANVAALGVKLWLDGGSVPNEWDATDTAVGTGVTFSGTTASFSGLSIPVTITATQYLITYDIITSPTNAQTMLAAVSSVTATNTVTNNDNTDATLTVDSVAPTVTFDLQAGSDSGTSSTDNITNVASPVFDASFSEAVAGFAAGDLSNTGTATGCSFAVGAPTGNTYPVTVTLCTEGTLIVRMAASGVTDTAGNNIAQTDGPTVTIDRTVPTITIANPTTTPEQSKTITASTSDGTLTMSNTTGSTCDGSLTFIAYSSQTFILESDNGTKVCYRAIDTAGNTAYSLSNAIAGIDTTAPTVAIDQAVGQADPTNASPIDFTVVFSESVSGFINTDVTLSSGTAVVTGGPTTYNVAVSGMSQGVLTASIGAGVATDTAGNGNIASSSTDNSVTYDNVGPTVTSDQAVGQADPTNASPIDFTVIFSESVIGFGSVDVDLSGSAGATTATVTGSGATYNVAVSGMTGDGTVIANVKAGAVQDALGNDSAASTSSDNQVIYDTTAPTVVIDTHPADPTSSTSAAFTFTTSGSPVEIDCKLDLGAYMACDTGSTQSYAGPLADGSHTFTVRVTDLATNSSSATYSWVIDTTAPVIVTAGIGSVPDSGDGSIAENEIVTVGLIQLLVSFSEDVYNPAGNSDPDDATNPDNYLLVRDNDDGIQTASCIGGVTGGDIQITINSITYSNNSGVGPFVATLNMNGGIALPNGTYRLIVCGTTSITDLVGISLAGDGVTAGTDFTRNFGVSILVAVRALPATGFAPNRVTVLPFQPDDKAYSAMGDLWLEIPKLGVKMNIVGVPQTKGGWDVSWLGSNAGWLQGSAYPTWAGNSVLTGHVWNADNSAGPFRYINTLWYGDKFIIHSRGAQYVYEVRSVLQVGPGNVNALMKHEELPWVTLVTCRGYDTAAGTYEYRVLVRAVLVEVK